jgi:hypothetical protein
MYDDIAIGDERQKEAVSVPLKLGFWQKYSFNGKKRGVSSGYKNLVFYSCTSRDTITHQLMHVVIQLEARKRTALALLNPEKRQYIWNDNAHICTAVFPALRSPSFIPFSRHIMVVTAKPALPQSKLKCSCSLLQ